MIGSLRIFKVGYLISDDRRQRITLGVILLALSVWRTQWESAGVADFIATAIQLELIVTGVVGWCPFSAYKALKKLKEKI